MIGSMASLLERMAALVDPLRGRILLVLERSELTVGELCGVFQLPQSTMSRHLKAMAEAGWVTVRAEGTARWYSRAPDRSGSEAERLWNLIRDEIASLPVVREDSDRLISVLAMRRSRDFFTTVAGEWDRIRLEMVGRRLDLLVLLGLLDDRWVVGDLGCGTGQVAEVLAPFVKGVVAIDESEAMLSAARRRVSHLDNVEVRAGGLEELPLQTAALDGAVMFLVLHHIEAPAAALCEVARVMRPGGRLVVVDLVPHDRVEYRQSMGHLWLGFEDHVLEGWLSEVGFVGYRYVRIPPDPEARGPALFVASVRRGG
jgi:SAM-dependent methyltransferase